MIYSKSQHKEQLRPPQRNLYNHDRHAEQDGCCCDQSTHSVQILCIKIGISHNGRLPTFAFLVKVKVKFFIHNSHYLFRKKRPKEEHAKKRSGFFFKLS